MKKFILFLLVSVLTLTLFGCNSSNGQIDSSKDQKQAEELEKLRGTEIIVASTFDPTYSHPANEKYSDFIKQYDINVSVCLMTKNNFVSNLARDYAAGLYFDAIEVNGHFPAIIPYLQPVKNSGIDTNDEIYNKSLLKASSVNGNPYLLSSKYDDYMRINLCFYNEAIFKKYNLTSPADFYKNDTWTIDNFWWCAGELKKLGYTNYIMDPGIFALYNTSLFSFDGTKIALNDHRTFYENACTLIDANNKGLISFAASGTNTKSFGLAVGNFQNSYVYEGFGGSYEDFESLRAIIPPKSSEKAEHYFTSPYEGYGLGYNAQNPKAVGFFLEYVLNTECDWDIFINSEVKSYLYNKVQEYSDKMLYYSDDCFQLAPYEGYAPYYAKWNEMSKEEYKEYLDEIIITYAKNVDEQNKSISAKLNE